MRKLNESSHMVNIENFSLLIEMVKEFDTLYVPVKTNLKIVNLEKLLNDAKNSMTKYRDAFNAFSVAIDVRQDLFNPIAKLTTRVLASFAVCDTEKSKINDLKSIVRKIQGIRVSPIEKIIQEEINAQDKKNDTAASQANTISASQMGYNNRLNSFLLLVSFLKGQPAYVPAETDINITGLTDYAKKLENSNNARMKAYALVNTTRTVRNKVMYASNIGLYDVAADVKKYVKSVFGATSREYLKISKVVFRKLG